MNDQTDSQLLRAYAERRSEPAFAELVRRHVDLVYSAAQRMVCDSHLAEDVTQGVFVALAKNASQLTDRPVLSGWLHRTAQNVAAQTVRTDVRRRAREQEAAAMNELFATEPDLSRRSGTESDVWEHVAPHLDAALGDLSETDRDALMLRYFERKSAQEMAQVLGVSDEAAQKRVSRAVERLREFFAKRGVTVGASGLTVVISANAVQAAPVGLAVTISTVAALAGTTLLTTATATVGKVIAMTTMQKALVTLALLAFLATATYKAFQANRQPTSSNQPDARSESTRAQSGNDAKRFNIFGSANNRGNQRVAPDLAKLAADLRAALHNVPRSPYGTRSYPSDEVVRALLNFGPDRREAFATLQDAVSDPDLEVRKRAISAMGRVGMVSTPREAQFGLVGDPAPEAKPLLWKVLLENDQELWPFALSSLRTIGFDANEIPALTDLMSHATNDQLLRYLPEAIAKTIQSAPDAAAPFVSGVEALLKHSDPGIQFVAACALAKHEAAGNPQILATLVDGLRSKNGLQQLMALETLQGIGSVAEPTVPAILEFADTTPNEGMKNVAFKAIGKIKSELRTGLPEVEQALKHEETIANWNEKFVSGSYTRQDLIDALKEPMFSVTAAKKLGEMGASAKDTIPNLISALSGQDQTKREQMVEAIQKIDPDVEIRKVNNRSVTKAALAARLTLDEKTDGRHLSLEKILMQNSTVNSEWRTQEEIVELAQQISAADQNVYRAFAAKLIQAEPGLTNLIPKPALK